MCGRFTLTASPAAVADAFGLAALEPFPPRYNIAPTQPILAVVGREPGADPGRADRQARLLRWGLIPGWAKEISTLPLLFNARSETAATKNAFRGAMRHRRCLIPASGFYEWRKAPGGRGRGQPFWMTPGPSAPPFAFAGLWETWTGPDGEELDTGAILTTEANDRLSAIHPRMPVVVEPSNYARWLDVRGVRPAEVADILAPAPEDVFEPVPVSEAINRTANTGPQVQTPLADAADGTSEDPAGSTDGADQPRLL